MDLYRHNRFSAIYVAVTPESTLVFVSYHRHYYHINILDSLQRDFINIKGDTFRLDCVPSNKLRIVFINYIKLDNVYLIKYRYDNRVNTLLQFVGASTKHYYMILINTDDGIGHFSFRKNKLYTRLQIVNLPALLPGQIPATEVYFYYNLNYVNVFIKHNEIMVAGRIGTGKRYNWKFLMDLRATTSIFCNDMLRLENDIYDYTTRECASTFAGLTMEQCFKIDSVIRLNRRHNRLKRVYYIVRICRCLTLK